MESVLPLTRSRWFTIPASLRGLGLLFMVFLIAATPAPSAPQYGIVRPFGNPLKNVTSPMGKLLEGRDGFFYGTSRYGGENNQGTIYRVGRDGSEFKVVRSFSGTATDPTPWSPLIQDGDGKLYGTTIGPNPAVFSFDPVSGNFITLKFLNQSREYTLPTGVKLAGDGMLYGVGDSDSANVSIIYRLKRDGSGFQVIRNITGSGGAPRWCRSALTEASDGFLYGTSRQGGASDTGTIYRLAKDGTGFRVVLSFGSGNTTPRNPAGGLIQGSDGRLYGMLLVGSSSSGDGSLYSVTTEGTDIKYASPFLSGSLHRPTGELVEALDGRLFGGGTSSNSNSSVFVINKDFSGFLPQGAVPYAEGYDLLYTPTLSGDGKLYVVAQSEIVRVTPDLPGHQRLHYFRASGGEATPFNFTEGADKWFYGISLTPAPGQFFKMRRDGSEFKVLRAFIPTANDVTGGYPTGPLQYAPDGFIYTTVTGSGAGKGSVIQLSPVDGSLKVVADFSSVTTTSPANPYVVIPGSDGLLYGATSKGGIPGWGTVFRVGRDGSGLKVLRDFTGNETSGTQSFFERADGRIYGVGQKEIYSLKKDGTDYKTTTNAGFASLIESRDGLFYGPQPNGGNVFGHGALKKVPPGVSGPSDVFLFDATGIGLYTPGALCEAVDDRLYGVTQNGGSLGYGAVYRIGRTGTGFEVLQYFNTGNEIGGKPRGIIASADGNIYGILTQGGKYGYGAIFRYGEATEITVADAAGAAVFSGGGLLDFGTRLPGDTVPPLTLTVRNTGTLPLLISRLTFDGAAAGDFTADPPPPGSLQAGGQTTLTVRFTPRVGGVRPAVLHVLSNDYDEATFDIPLTAVVPAPEIGVNEGTLTGPELQSGQTARLDFGETRQPNPVAKRFVISNSGGAALQISRVTVPDGFTFTLPQASVPCGASATLDVTLTAQTSGSFSGLVTLLNDDPDEGSFTFPVSGTVVTPEIALHNGGSTSAPELGSGQAAAVDFGINRLGTPGVREFTIANTGTAPLLVHSVTAPNGFSLNTAFATPKTLAAGTSATFAVSLSSLILGPHAGPVTVQSDDFDEGVFTFPVSGTVVTPEIALHNGGSTSAPELGSGQAAAVDFGINRLGTPGVREFTIANTGTAPLLVHSVTVPDGFSLNTVFAAPATLAAGTSATFAVSLSSPILGPHAGPVTVQSDDFDEGVFTFPVGGTVVTPEIALHNGGTTAAPELSSGQAAAVDFGRNIQGTPGLRPFTIANTGTAPLLVRSMTVPDGFTLNSMPALPSTIPPGGSLKMEVSLTSLAVGMYAGLVAIQSDDLDEGNFTFSVSGEVFIPAPITTLPVKTTALNRQTGLREQTVHLANDTTATVPGYRLLIAGLPGGVTVKNAAEIRSDGTTVVLVNRPLGPHSSFDLVLEYGSATRLPADISPRITVEVLLEAPASPQPDGTGTLAIERLVPLPDGGMMLEFASRAGARYEVQYSPDGTVWKTSPSPVQAGGNRCQWIDRGPPRTDTAPAQSGKRFYRVRELAP